MVAAHLAWAKGGHAEVVSLEADALVLRSTTPAPPGARLEATFVADPPAALKIKSHGSKREDDGSFVIKGRLVDATREIRARVASMAGLAHPE
jgi:hypothetical protein